MQIDYIRRDVNEAISEDGGAYIQLVNKNTVGLKTSISEAKSALYVVGAESMIEGYFVGIMRSVFEGIREDGHPRTVGDITFYPVCGGTFDLDRGWDPAANDVRVYARLINGVTLDISDWTFRDVTPGRVTFTLDTVANGAITGIVSTDRDAELNGKNLPAKEKLSVSWACGTKGGEVPADKFTANVARITVDKSVFASLAAADDGKDITFTVKGCYNKAWKTATLKYVAPPAAPTITKIVQEDQEGDDIVTLSSTSACEVIGTNFDYKTGDTATIELYQDGVKVAGGTATVENTTATKIFIGGFQTDGTVESNEWINADTKFVLTTGGHVIRHALTFV